MKFGRAPTTKQTRAGHALILRGSTHLRPGYLLPRLAEMGDSGDVWPAVP